MNSVEKRPKLFTERLFAQKKMLWLSRNEGNTFAASLELSSDSQKYRDWKKIRCNAANVWPAMCPWNREIIYADHFWNISLSVKLPGQPCAVWQRGTTQPEVVKCEPVQDRAHAKRDGHMITSLQTERQRAVIKTAFIRMKLVCVDYTFHAIYQKKTSLCSVLITPSFFNLLKADIQWKAKQWRHWTPGVLFRHSLNRWPEAKV